MSPTPTMTTSVMPSEGAERGQVAAVGEFLKRHPGEATGPRARLVSPDGEEVEIPAQLLHVLRHVSAMLTRGDGVAVSAVARELSTTEAAKLLGMSRPTLVRLLDTATIPCHRVGSHRRLLLSDVLAFRHRQMQERRRSYEALMLESDALGLNDDE
ncbi:helix-turn-helix domain-containing protein [Micromonospora phytophila]|uniref:helix-turn-helix domain-containing protein n=1 Tax=Micromonospora phytophila TaxID=709888 RepID=UPI00203048E5|nr:helix-turn-helix domain-containing protein [Micromonospora phytophila]MCM0676742.1 helix-turn-helix domain-containing protein [Micromonospora phytophila]